MPDDDGQAAAMLGLIDAAQGAGVNFTAIQPGTPIPLVGYTRYPMALSFIGNYYDLTEFLYRLRNGVTVRDGVLDATSRLFTVDTVNWHASDEEDEKFPLVQADLIVSAYVYGSDVDLVTAQVAADAAGEEQPATTGTEPGSTTTPTEPGSTAPEAPSRPQQERHPDGTPDRSRTCRREEPAAGGQAEEDPARPRARPDRARRVAGAEADEAAEGR